MEHVPGEDKGDVKLYALSTCGWCNKTKKLLNELGVEYRYTDVDLLEGAERDAVMDDVCKFNPKCTLPTLVINDKECIVGYNEDEIRNKFGD
ncbi:MAG: glutaredoxin family protein [Archaeoglobaceae archaeon]